MSAKESRGQLHRDLNLTVAVHFIFSSFNFVNYTHLCVFPKKNAKAVQENICPLTTVQCSFKGYNVGKLHILHIFPILYKVMLNI